MEYEKIRNYEVSIWTLQDSFITVLKPSDLENKGQIQEGKFKLNTDGTQELTFNVPMYLEPGIENPVWYDIKNGIIIEDMRKIKLIFNKNTDDEEVFEFLINSVTERHENDQLYCEVSCEGLAFNELGKRGFKIALNEDDYYNDEEVIAWYDGNKTDKSTGEEKEEPIANIQYWLNKFLKQLPENKDEINPYIWYYELNMDWSSYPYGDSLSNNKIYEDEYATTWGINKNNELVAEKVEPPKEKSRLVDLEESNIYNLTQSLAEAFGVFCKYIYEHDENYHITCRKVVFYNTFFAEKEGFIDFTYPYSSAQITRTKDSKDLVTKLFVKSVEDKDTASGLITILDADTNPTKEDYILNFDYLHEIGTISEEQYAEVKEYEKEIFQLNSRIIPYEEQIAVLSEQLPDLEAKLTIAENAKKQDTERLEDANSLFEALTEGDGVITISESAPKTAVLMQDSAQDSKKNYFYIKISEQGVIANTVKLWKNLKYTKKETEGKTEMISSVADEIEGGGTPQFDEFGNLVRINNIYWNPSETRKMIYITYSYSPKLYYDNVKKIWEKRLAKDQADAADLKTKVDLLKTNITYYEELRDDLLKQKKILIELFEEEFGAAIREGYWTPEDYTNYGNRLNDSIQLNLSPRKEDEQEETYSNEIPGLTPYASFVWDTKNFEGEQEAYYTLGVNQDKNYYPCIDLKTDDNNNFIDVIKDKLDDLCLLYWDYTATQTMPRTANRLRSLPFGSQCQLAFMYDNELNVHPVLLITGEKSLYGGANSTAADWIKENGFIGKLSTQLENGAINISYTSYIDNSYIKNRWIDLKNNNMSIVYPRIKINSLAVKTGPDEHSISYNGTKLEQYEDYSLASRTDVVDNENIESAYYFTIKPKALIKSGTLSGTFGFFYTLSTAANAIYLDALQVSRENAYPKVSYTISPNLYGRDFMHIAYKYLGALAHINDTDLKFENVMGYISDLELDLDKPWEDQAEIKNYKSKFEDIFSSIVAQTEAMKSSQPILSSAANVLMLDGTLSQNAIQDTLRRVDLDYAFNNGTLTIDNENGIWGTSDNGVVAMRGGGIFTATEKDDDGNWKWNTGITPEGINADLITTGQLDTNRINIYAGDNIKLQLNKNGLYAYKNYLNWDESVLNSIEEEDKQVKKLEIIKSLISVLNENGKIKIEKDAQNEIVSGTIAPENEIDYNQFVKFDENGLFLIAKQDAIIQRNTKNSNQQYFDELDQDVTRAEISWNGLKLRNWNNEEVFYADPDTGNLTLKGRIEADSGSIGGWEINEDQLSGSHILLIPNDIPGGSYKAGIYTTSESSGLPYSIEISGKTYYRYIYKEGSEDEKYFYNTNLYKSNVTVTQDNVDEFLKVKENIIAVTPKANAMESVSEKIGTETKDVEVEDVHNDQGDSTSSQTVTITEDKYQTYIYIKDPDSEAGQGRIIVDATAENDWEKYLTYDQDNTENSTWYTELKKQVPTNYLNYVIITTVEVAGQYEQATINDFSSDNKIVHAEEFNPTLKIIAENGYLETKNGKLGSFNLDSTYLKDGNLDNTKIIRSSITNSKIENKPTTNFLRAFCDITSNSAAGTFTLTRIDGTTANFNITAMQRYQTDMAVNYQSGFSGGYTAGNDAGFNNGKTVGARNKTVSSLGEVTLGSSDTGTSEKSTTITYNDGNKDTTKTISINASAVYRAGKNDVTLSSAGWINGTNIVKTNAPTPQEYTVNLPEFQTSGGTTFNSSHKTTVYFSTQSIQTPLKQVEVDATSEYNAGWTAAYDIRGVPGSNTSSSMDVVFPGSNVGTTSTYTYTVSADNNYAYIKNAVGTTVARATNSGYTNGQKSVTLSSGGWTQYATNTITASNGAQTTVSIPNITVTAGSWSNGDRTISAYYGNSGVLGSTTISLPSASNVSWSWSNPAQGYVSASITIAGKTYSSQHKV